ncbi:WXG100 family type VII secretion target [Actinokineospora bangkokensis]|uniref:ESAT-6-like protein n=1 Tax=Actinokineospora bangkokensis TaxID=1193682 RepID=A0A1Q9LJG5_9PSEU|nr:WXG100 family type VII secretion target [Actinokineospora bangkokensis]OLR92197.1 hypothetical protein BJP25_22990 [Actinokineospora bangkokensis]
MTNPVSTDTLGMQRAAQQFEAASSESTGHLRSVNETILALQSTWKGDASNNFSRAMNDWENQFQIIINELNNMIQVMGGNAKAYDAAEQEAVNLAPQFGFADGLPGL